MPTNGADTNGTGKLDYSYILDQINAIRDEKEAQLAKLSCIASKMMSKIEPPPPVIDGSGDQLPTYAKPKASKNRIKPKLSPTDVRELDLVAKQLAATFEQFETTLDEVLRRFSQTLTSIAGQMQEGLEKVDSDD